MKWATSAAGTLLSLAVFSSACDGGASGPTSASPVPSSTYTLSGTISEMTASGLAPVQGALVNSGASAMTDADGLYSIPGLSAMGRSVVVTKNGYVSKVTTVAMSADTRLDIQIERIATFVLSGVVYEMTEVGQVPVEGVEVYCDSCGSPDGHTFVHTGADGSYSLAWAANGVHPLFVTKAGYEIYDPTGKLKDSYGRINATVQGDTRFDVELVRR